MVFENGFVKSQRTKKHPLESNCRSQTKNVFSVCTSQTFSYLVTHKPHTFQASTALGEGAISGEPIGLPGFGGVSAVDDGDGDGDGAGEGNGPNATMFSVMLNPPVPANTRAPPGAPAV